MKRPFRRKLRNCIRKDTFRYFVEQEKISYIWDQIILKYGPPVVLTDFSMEIVEDERAKFKKGIKECQFTLIKKTDFNQQDEQFINRLTGVSA